MIGALIVLARIASKNIEATILRVRLNVLGDSKIAILRSHQINGS